jgi:transcriptional regulator with XRE-family HTH domain
VSDIFRDYSFGGWLRHMRIEKRITLREFAIRVGTDAGNISKLERSELPPPVKAERVDELVIAIDRPDASEFMRSLAFQHHVAKLRKEFLTPTTEEK